MRLLRFLSPFSSSLSADRSDKRGPSCPVTLPFIAVLCLCVSIFAVYAATRFEFYYFNPDSVQSNLSRLSLGFNSFFQKLGFDASFQAFAHKRDFDQRLQDDPPDLVLVPSWYFEQHGRSLGMIPLLASLENGKPSYTKYLLVRRDTIFTGQDLKGKTVAMTTMGSNAQELLNSYFKEQGVDFSLMNIINTPKDADALYALVLRQVDAALVGQATLDTIGRAGLRVLQGTKRLMASAPVPTPLICALPGAADKAEVLQMKRVLLGGKEKSSSAPLMDMLYINGWQKVH